MDNRRYENTLGEIPADMVGIHHVGVGGGYLRPEIADGFVLTNGIALREEEKDKMGFYIGGAELYELVRDEEGGLVAFRKMNAHITQFTEGELSLISQFALNTKENLMEDLSAVQRATKNLPLKELAASTVAKLKEIPDAACVSLMADVYFVYKSRNLQILREQEKASYRRQEEEMEL